MGGRDNYVTFSLIRSLNFRSPDRKPLLFLLASMSPDPGAAPEGAPQHQPVLVDPGQEPGDRAPQGAHEVPARGQEGQAAAPQGDRRRQGGRQGARTLQGPQGVWWGWNGMGGASFHFVHNRLGNLAGINTYVCGL